MKNIIWPIVVLIIAIGFAVLSRYEVIVKTPVVVKVDRLTGDSWIVNSGYWVKVKDMADSAAASGSTAPAAEATGQKTQ